MIVRLIDSIAAVCFFIVAVVLAAALTFAALAHDLGRNLRNIWSD